MVNDVSGFGLKATLIASTTFPAGITITQFADDTDPLDSPSMQIADKAMGLNGDLIKFSKATPIMATLAVIPESDDDKNLAILMENNRVGAGKISTQDILTLVLYYPSGKVVTMTNGIMTDGMTASSVASAGRLKSKPYAFAFENRVSA